MVVIMNGAECSPNSSTKSTKYCPRHFMPSRRQSSGWIATFRYALARSNLAINVPPPRVIMPSMKAFTETYWTVNEGLGMPSFTLCPQVMKGPNWDATSQADYFWGSPQNNLCAKTKNLHWSLSLYSVPLYSHFLHTSLTKPSSGILTSLLIKKAATIMMKTIHTILTSFYRPIP